MEEQRCYNSRRRKALESNRPKTYKSAEEGEVNQNLGHFDVACFHYGALHFPQERVSNRINFNSFGDCCLH